MSDPTQPPHHGDEPPRFPTGSGGAFGMPPVGPPQSSQHPSQNPAPTSGRRTRAGLTADDLTWGGAAHWSALVAAFFALGFLGPLIIMLTKGNTSPYVRRQSVESLNFQLSILIYGAVSAVLVLVLVGILLLVAVRNPVAGLHDHRIGEGLPGRGVPLPVDHPDGQLRLVT